MADKCVSSGLPKHKVCVLVWTWGCFSLWKTVGLSPTVATCCCCCVLEQLQTAASFGQTSGRKTCSCFFCSESPLIITHTHTHIYAHTLSHLDHQAPTASHTQNPRLVCFHPPLPFDEWTSDFFCLCFCFISAACLSVCLSLSLIISLPARGRCAMRMRFESNWLLSTCFLGQNWLRQHTHIHTQTHTHTQQSTCPVREQVVSGSSPLQKRAALIETNG